MSTMVTRLSEALKGSLSMQPHMQQQLNILSVDHPDGRTTVVAHLPFKPENREELDIAVGCFAHRFRGRGTVSVALERSLTDVGVTRPELVPSWDEYVTTENKKLFNALRAQAIDPKVVAAVEESLAVGRNRSAFVAAVREAPYSGQEREAIVAALAVATEAHRGVTAARPQDSTGLFHIPYVNHPITMARTGVQLGLSATAIQALLLHDVVEDSPITASELRKKFSPAVVDMVEDMTRKSGESRDQFLARVSGLTGEAKICKAIDRFDNMVRSFGISDPTYHARLLSENERVYAPAFVSVSALAPLADKFFLLDRELSKFKQSLE
jgi:hypothetical protein